MEDRGPSAGSDGPDTYAEDRTSRLHRNRVVGFALSILLWAVSIVPLARESMAVSYTHLTLPTILRV